MEIKTSKKNLIALISATLLTTGCATNESFNNALNTGREGECRTEYVPAKLYPINDTEILVDKTKVKGGYVRTLCPYSEEDLEGTPPSPGGVVGGPAGYF